MTVAGQLLSVHLLGFERKDERSGRISGDSVHVTLQLLEMVIIGKVCLRRAVLLAQTFVGRRVASEESKDILAVVKDADVDRSTETLLESLLDRLKLSELDGIRWSIGDERCT